MEITLTCICNDLHTISMKTTKFEGHFYANKNVKYLFVVQSKCLNCKCLTDNKGKVGTLPLSPLVNNVTAETRGGLQNRIEEAL